MEERGKLIDSWDQLLAEIRGLDDFDRFLLPPQIQDLLAAAKAGPIVLINVSGFGSAAILMRSSGLEVVNLPELSPSAVQAMVSELFTAIEGVAEREHRLERLLGWLWDAVTGPVLDRLGITGPPAHDAPWPRVWWCPSGLLSFLPLHAAGHHATRFDTTPQTVMDRVVSSYTPTVRVLMHARRATGPAQTDLALVVAMPVTPGEAALPGALDEEQLVARWASKWTNNAEILRGHGATYDAVTTSLRRCRTVHFACHGISDLANPFSGQLLLHDHERRKLTVADITQLRADEAELAFLSACSTFQTGAQLADEVIHLASAFQMSGYRHVIATLWPIYDKRAFSIAEGVYGGIAWPFEVDSAAQALHRAIQFERSLEPDRPSAWAAHVHSGI